MNENMDYAYWMALSHLPKWSNEEINHLIIDIVHSRKISMSDFFELNSTDLTQEFNLTASQASDIEQTKLELPNYSFIAEDLLQQGFELIPFNSKNYSETLKQNLKTKFSPPLLYIKGNAKLLNEPSVAIVGSRKASDISLLFARNIAEKCVKDYEVVVSGFAKGVDTMALDATLEFHGRSIVVLPQGILTFGSGIKKYYTQIISGDVLIVSAYHPKAPWSVGLAMNRNVYIYGLAKTIYVAELDSKGGTWAGVMDGLKKGRKIYIRKPEPNETNANDLIIMRGAIPLDSLGNVIEDVRNQVEEQLKRILSNRPLTAKEICSELGTEIEVKELQQLLSRIEFIESKRIKSEKHYFLKNSIPPQQGLFS